MLVQVAVHETQMPDRVRADLLESLRTRKADHKFHYDSVKQTQKWLRLHETFSPARTDPDCATTYRRAFEAAVKGKRGRQVLLVGLGCGGGEKDVKLLRLLQREGKRTRYLPCDVSLAMTLVAWKAASEVVGPDACFPLVCDLAKTDEPEKVLAARAGEEGPWLLTFFGMIPNFEPEVILPKVARLVRPEDLLLLSANLAPGPNYQSGVKQILPLYENEPTADWLMTLLTELGVERSDGAVRFAIEADPGGRELLRVAAYFKFGRGRTVRADEQEFKFEAGDDFRLFFSYRYTEPKLRESLAEYGLRVEHTFISKSQEEGVFLVRRREA